MLEVKGGQAIEGGPSGPCGRLAPIHVLSCVVAAQICFPDNTLTYTQTFVHFCKLTIFTLTCLHKKGLEGSKMYPYSHWKPLAKYGFAPALLTFHHNQGNLCDSEYI